MSIDTIDVRQARLRFSENTFAFTTTEELKDHRDVIAQSRAVRALEFALSIQDRRFNLFVAGASGTGRSSIVTELAKRFVDHNTLPPDWCYVHNFDTPNRPLALSLKAGNGRILAEQVDVLIQDLKREIPKLITSSDFRRRHEKLIDNAFDHRRTRIDALNERALEHNVRVVDTSETLKLVPLMEDGSLMEEEALEKLDDEKKRRIEDIERLMRDELLDYIESNRRLQEEIDVSLKALEEEVLHELLAPRMKSISEIVGESEGITRYLTSVENDVVKHFRDFLTEDRPTIPSLPNPRSSMVRYKVNVLIDSSLDPNPVITESNPTYYNLIGRAERRLSFGALETNHMLIRTGALLKSSGGILIVNAEELLTAPFAYQGLKRCLREARCTIEDPDELLSSGSVESLRPEPIPIEVKLIMIGTLDDYMLLSHHDEQFLRLIKVRADFESSTDLNDELALQFAHFVGHQARINNLLHFTPSGVAALIEHSSRLSGRQDRLSLRFSPITDFLIEANYWAKKDEASFVDRTHVKRAEQERRYRGGLMQEHLLNSYRRKSLLIDVEGREVGQVNGLAVLGMDHLSYGMPMRITAKTFAGSSGVVSIERESDLSGQIHSKAVLTLTGYLGGMYAQEQALSLAASISFEQNYSIIDGDSASLAEVIAIISSISNVPVYQHFAITGSMNQHGEVQPVGGLNEKIEGFFDVCSVSGLTGKQAVIIPALNRADLNLEDRVLKAMKKKKFHVYSVTHIDDAIRLLTGRTPGIRKKNGSFPTRSVHGKAAAHLASMNAKEEKN